MDGRRRERIVAAATALRAAEKPVRVLRSVAWPASVKQRFFERGARELPVVEYAPFRLEREVREAVRAGLAGLGDGPEEGWLRRQGEVIETAAAMLGALGTPAFLELGARLYGAPAVPMQDGRTTPLELARTVDTLAVHLDGMDLGAPAPACHLAEEVARTMQRAVRERFGGDAPEVSVVEELSSNALAGPTSVRIRRGACFTDKDVHQLVHHEAYIHVCTSLNGRSQTELPILASGHPGTTRTQEGLAVFAEFISGAMEPDRFRRLADRVLAMQMAIEGADFLEVFRFFEDRAASPEQAFENARRVFRGGVLTGGAPFTKDVVYLGGLLTVTNFMRIAVAEGRADCILLLFCGKLDIEDLPALSRLSQAGLCRAPRFLPPWVEDRRFLVAYLAFSRFLNRVDMERVREHYRELLQEIVPVGRAG